jgi:uncharacterized protein
MNVRNITTAVAAGLALTSALAHADFQAALGEYRAGHYDAAHQQFLALAELGDCSSQFNLGAMALKGQGGVPDTGSGVGWLQAAASNGCQQLVGNKLPALTAKLTPDEARNARAILARYGRDALISRGVLNPDLTCSGTAPPTVLSQPKPEYPPEGAHRNAIVIAALTIGADGRARDPEILQSVPDERFAASAVAAWLNSVYAPAERNGQAVESRVQAKMLFNYAGAEKLADEPVFRQARPAANSGDAAAEYLVGLTSTLDGTLGLSPGQGSDLVLASARDGDPSAQYWVGSQLHTTASCHPHADGDVWLQHAAEGGNAAAQVLLARELLRGGAGAAQITQARALLEKAASSESYYVRKHVAALLAASPIEGLRDPPTALSVAHRLAAGPIQSDPQMFEVLAAAHAANGDYHDAVAQQERALEKAKTLGWNTTAMTARLAAYRNHQSWQGDLFASS